jgi:hypothetical protein
MNRRTLLTVRTNDEAIREVHKLADEGISKIQQMHSFSIPMIEAESKRLLENLRKVDLSRILEKEIDENIYYRGQAPAGAAMTHDFSGPLTGLPFPPRENT